MLRKALSGAVCFITFVAAVQAMAQEQIPDTSVKKKGEPTTILDRFRGSNIRTDISLGSGSFVTGEDGNGFASQAFTFYPRFKVADKQSVRLYWVLECEFTKPDNPTGRKCDPSDVRLSYHHGQIWKDPLLEGTLFGYAGLYFPTGYASRNNNTVTNVRANLSYMATFFSNKLELMYGFIAQKYLPTSKTRDSNVTPGSINNANADAGSTGSGGRYNDNWLFINNFHAGFNFTKKLSLSVDLLLLNYLRYSAPDDALTAGNAVDTGRADWTWGIIEATYQPAKWAMVHLGVQSLQPALTSDNSSVRFPFYDFISPANNFTKWYVAGTFIY